MQVAKLTSKGQITIPKAIRIKLSVKPGDRLKIDVDEQGVLRAVPIYETNKPLYGYLSRLAESKPVSPEDVDRGIAQFMGEKFTRKK